MEINKFDNSNIKMVRDLIQKKLDELQMEIGVSVTLGNIKYNEDSLHAKVDAVPVAKAVQAAANPQNMFNKKGFMVGLKPEDYKARFMSNGKVMTFVKFDFAKHKYPVITTDGTKQYKMTVEQFKNGKAL